MNYIEVKEASALLHVTAKTVRKWVRRGRLPSTRTGEASPHYCGKILIPRDAVEGLLDSRFKPAEEKPAPAAPAPKCHFMGGCQWS